jgi:hypothetical protein
MGYVTINSGDYIESSWANTEVRDQVVSQFGSATARDTAIVTGSRVPGMTVALTTNTATEGLYQWTSASTWRLPWNLPWGNVSISALPAAFTFTSTVGYSNTFTWSAINHRNYLVTYVGEMQNATLTGVINTVGMYSGTTALSYSVIRDTPPQSNSQISGSASFVYTSTASGTQTWRLRGDCSAGSTTQTFAPYAIIIQDIGPSGAPA